MSIINFYSSADPSAPALSGTAGSLTQLLDAILVNGYGSGDNRKEPCGWTIAYSEPNRRAYRNDPVEGVGGYLALDDRGVSFTDARSARARAYEIMQSVELGFGAAPSETDTPPGAWIPKSNQLNSSARAWVAWGNATRFGISIDVANNGLDGGGWVFLAGDWLDPISSADYAVFGISSPNRHTNRTAWNGSITAAQSSNGFPNVSLIGTGDYDSSGNMSGHSFLTTRGPNGIEQFASNGFSSLHSAQNRLGGHTNAIPHPAHRNGIWISPVFLVHNGQPRGRLKGTYAPLQGVPFPQLVPIEDLSGFEGTTLVPVNTREGPSTSVIESRFGQILLDSNPGR